MQNIEPIKESIKAAPHEPEYTVHRYFARRPDNVINNIIKHYLPNKNSIILDPFGGGGTMLYEALTCGHRAVACDTSDLACFVMEQESLMANADIETLSTFVNHLMRNLSSTFARLYSYSGKEVYWIEWSSYTQCPNCAQKVYLSPYNTLGSGKYTCGSCDYSFKPTGVCADSIEPVEICCVDAGSIKSGVPKGQERIRPSLDDLRSFYDQLCNGLNELGLESAMVPITPIPDCNLQRESALHKKGILYFEQFLPKATRAVITYIGNYIVASALNEAQKEQLLFVLSASLRYCSRFSSLNRAWRGDKPMEWAKSNFWTPYTFVEVNPIITFFERWQSYVLAVKNASHKFEHAPTKGTCSEVLKGRAQFAVLNQSSEKIDELPKESVDLIVTDPPYGSYLHYGELSAFWTTWLSKFLPRIKAVPDRVSEAVPARKKGYPGWKTFSEYEEILSNVFLESYRILKNEHYCVVTFNNKEPEAWIAFLRSVKRAGFILPPSGIIFQDGVESYKKSIDSRRGGAIFGDFVYSFVKVKNTVPCVRTTGTSWRDNLDKSLSMLHASIAEISNVELYTRVYLGLLPELYDAIDTEAPETSYMNDLDFKNFEAKINEYYSFSDGIWEKK